MIITLVKSLLAMAEIISLLAIVTGVPLGFLELSKARYSKDPVEKYHANHMGVWMLLGSGIGAFILGICFVISLILSNLAA